jgi:hypothetical protein
LANEKNLIPNAQRTPKELREQCRNGGIASGKARRQKNSIKSILKTWAESPIAVESLKKQAEQFGLNTDEGRSLLTLALLKGAMKGNSQYMERVLTMLGEDDPNSTELMDDGFNAAIKGTAAEDWKESGNV